MDAALYFSLFSKTFMSIPTPQRILVIRRDNIGDLVCTTPFLHTLRQAMPGTHIAVLVNSYNRAVLDGNPDVDEVFAYDKLKHKEGVRAKVAAVFARIWLLVQLRWRRFDLAILAKPGTDKYAFRMARLSGARRILGFRPTDEDTAYALTDPVIARDAQHSHEVEAIAQLAAPLGIPRTAGPLRLFPNAGLQTRYRTQLGKEASPRRWLALHISAREKSRQWPAQKFIELIERLGQSEGFADLGFALLWSPGAASNPTHPGDDEKAAEIIQRTQAFAVRPLQTGQLEELVAGLSICDGFVGADGGAMHVAVGVGIPVIALFENSQAKREHWYPWQSRHRLLQPSTFPVADIEVSAVFAAVRELLPAAEAPNASTSG